MGEPITDKYRYWPIADKQNAYRNQWSVLADKKGHIGKVTDINKNNYNTEIFFNFLTNKSQNIEM